MMEEDQEEEEEGQLDINNKPKAASEEGESPDQQAAAGATDDTAVATAGTGRSYECIFCKRGFSAAQALGGHMNIHRKDRARVTKGASASASASTRRGAAEDGAETNYGHYHPYSLHRRSSSSFSSPVPVFSDYPSKSCLSQDQCSTNTTHRSDNTELRSSVEKDPGVVRRPSEQSPFGDEELDLELGLHRDGDHGSDQEKELDLELRLGHDPR